MVSRRLHEELDDDEKRRAFDELYESTFDQILAYCRRRSLRREDAEDAVADTYLTAWRRIDEAVNAESPRAWLYGVAFRVTANRRRGRDRFRALIDRLAVLARPSVNVSAEDVALTDASGDAVYAALQRLTPIEQELIRLAALEGIAHAEIGTIIGLSPSAVRTRLYRAKKRLRAQLEDDLPRDIDGLPDTYIDGKADAEPPSDGSTEIDRDSSDQP